MYNVQSLIEKIREKIAQKSRVESNTLVKLGPHSFVDTHNYLYSQRKKKHCLCVFNLKKQKGQRGDL